MEKSKKMPLSNKIEIELNQLEKNYESLLKELKLFVYDGDFSENADWLLLQEKKEVIQKEIIQKQKQLMDSKNNNQQKQEFTYLLLGTGEKKTVQLTYDWEADPDHGRISFNSPLGLALVNKKAGEISEVRTQQNNYKIKILTKQ